MLTRRLRRLLKIIGDWLIIPMPPGLAPPLSRDSPDPAKRQIYILGSTLGVDMSDFVRVTASYLSICQRKKPFGVGINDAPYLTRLIDENGNRKTCPFYSRWIGVLERCYSKSLIKRRPSYAGCNVCDEWLTFSNFLAWMERQDWHGMALDKDLKIAGNKTYSPDACVFIPIQLNSLLTGKHRNRSLPDGVDFHRQRMMYRARYSWNGKNKYLGHYHTAEEASSAYRQHKAALVLSYIDDYPELEKGLIDHAKIIMEK